MANIPFPHMRVNTGPRSRLLSLLAEKQNNQPLEPSSHTHRLISESTDAVNCILSSTGCPPSSRAFVDAVIGAAHSRLKSESTDEWFEASDLEIARGALADRRDLVTVDALKKWTQRHRRAFFDWQSRSGYTLIECEPGGQDDERNNYPTRYRAPLIAAAADALIEAKSDPAWERDPEKAMAEAAKIAVTSLPSTTAKHERFRRPRQDGTALVRRNTSTINSLFRKNLDILTRKAALDAEKVIASAQAHFEEVVRAARAALDEVIEQAKLARDGGQTGGGNSSPVLPEVDQTDACVHTPVDKCVHPSQATDEPSEQASSRDGLENESISRLSQIAASPRVCEKDQSDQYLDDRVSPPCRDRSIHRGVDSCVHSLNTDKNGQTQGGILADGSDGSASDHLSDALMDVCAFESVGVRAFDVSIIGEVRLDGTRKFYDFMKHVPVDGLRELLPSLVDRCERERLNLIIRPRVGADRRLVQLDDLDQAAMERVRELAFRVAETSQGNYQAWLCVIGGDEEMERRLKKAIGADAGANGATRIAGSLNVKEQRRNVDGSYTQVRLIASGRRRLAVEEVAEMIGDDEMPPCVSSSSSSVRIERLLMPDYDEFVSRARLSSSGEIDRSAVDYAWAATALGRGHSVEDVMLELSKVSLKAASLSRSARESYIRRTVRAAARE